MSRPRLSPRLSPVASTFMTSPPGYIVGGPSALEVLGSMNATDFPGWWTTGDSALGPLPGISYTGILGENAVVTQMLNQRPALATLLPLVGGGPSLEIVDGALAIRCHAAGAKALQGTFSTLVAAGNRPMFVVVARAREISDTNYILLEASAGGSFTSKLQFTGSTLSQGFQSHPNVTMVEAVGAWTDVEWHTIAGWIDPGEGLFIARDGEILANLPLMTAATVNLISRITLGANRNGAGVQNIDIREAFVFRNFIGHTRLAELCAVEAEK